MVPLLYFYLLKYYILFVCLLLLEVLFLQYHCHQTAKIAGREKKKSYSITLLSHHRLVTNSQVLIDSSFEFYCYYVINPKHLSDPRKHGLISFYLFLKYRVYSLPTLTFDNMTCSFLWGRFCYEGRTELLKVDLNILTGTSATQSRSMQFYLIQDLLMVTLWQQMKMPVAYFPNSIETRRQ